MAARLYKPFRPKFLGNKLVRTKSTSVDVAIIGGGHNGLVAASYLQKAGKRVAIFERRHVIGGAAVTEEIIPGFKFSRASYLLSLLRPQIVRDLELKKYGLEVFLREPNSYTPHLHSNRSLTLGGNYRDNYKQIAQFSKKDAEKYSKYEQFMLEMVQTIDPLLDEAPVDLLKLKASFSCGRWQSARHSLQSVKALLSSGASLGSDIGQFWELLTAPAEKVLNQWFESEPLKATLATDAVIGAMASPRTPGSGYVLLHHVMGELEGKRNAWAFVKGGMGGVSQAIADSALANGAKIYTDKPVSKILLNGLRAGGVVLEDGSEVYSNVVLSNATPKVTFLDLMPKNVLPENFVSLIEAIDYTSPVTKINVALSGLPSFTADPNTSTTPMPHHQCTIHLNTESINDIHEAYLDAAVHKVPSKRPMIEMCIPSSLDSSLAPNGCHVATLFTQYTPFELDKGEWSSSDKEQYADRVFDCIEEYAPGFRQLVIGRDILTPPDLERIFGLTGGNIFHGAMSLDQLYMTRPVPSHPSYSTPVSGLYLCGSGAHPGGGVMGSPGRLCAQIVLEEGLT